jgi:general secretion pathway protein H
MYSNSANQPRSLTSVKANGFTLIELMLVVVLVGIMASFIQISGNNNQPEQLLKRESSRFAGVFDLAAEYSMLNNIELGLLIDKTNYQFLGYDGVRWSALAESDILTSYTLPQGLEMSLQLEDLPIEDGPIFSASSFIEQDEDEGLSEDEEKIVPQVFILSGGDISPFSLSFHFDDEQDIAQGLSYRVTGLYTSPLTIEGPIVDAQ